MTFPFPRLIRLFRSAFFGSAALVLAPLASAATVDFNRDIQPILSENCYHCHGPDGAARKAKLRLDQKEGALGKNEDGRAIVAPGKPAESELITRIQSADSDEVMPPPKSHRKLTAGAKAIAHPVGGTRRAVGAALGVRGARAAQSAGDRGLRIAD